MSLLMHPNVLYLHTHKEGEREEGVKEKTEGEKEGGRDISTCCNSSKNI